MPDSTHKRHRPRLQKPDYRLKEEAFLTQTENFGTGLWRALRIFIEYLRGFYAFRKLNHCVTVFGSARFPEDHPYYRMARLVGRQLAKHGFTVMTGGGPGIMAGANQGAQEISGKSISCSIELNGLNGEKPNTHVNKTITMRYFFVRKFMLTKYSLAFVFMPGGFGTLDELFEVVTLIRTQKLRNFPVILMCKDFWQPLVGFMQDTLLTNKTIDAEDFGTFFITDSPEAALDYIHRYLSHPHGPSSAG
jgi:hypothetical protein